MPRLSITLTEEQNERVEELVENGEYKSKNAVVQDWLSDAEKVNQVESENERLHRERRQLLNSATRIRSWWNMLKTRSDIAMQGCFSGSGGGFEGWSRIWLVPDHTLDLSERVSSESNNGLKRFLRG